MSMDMGKLPPGHPGVGEEQCVSGQRKGVEPQDSFQREGQLEERTDGVGRGRGAVKRISVGVSARVHRKQG